MKPVMDDIITIEMFLFIDPFLPNLDLIVSIIVD